MNEDILDVQDEIASLLTEEELKEKRRRKQLQADKKEEA